MTTAKGSTRGVGGVRRIVVSFDPETFVQISRRATRARHSFAEEVRLLVEFGLEDVEP